MQSPLHTQLTQSLLQELASGYYETGERFLSIRQIADRWAVAPGTAEKSLRHLLDTNLLQRRPRSGYFLRHNARQRALLQLKERPILLLPMAKNWQHRRFTLRGNHTSAGAYFALLLNSSDLNWIQQEEETVPPQDYSSTLKAFDGFRRTCAILGHKFRTLNFTDTLKSQQMVIDELRDENCKGIAVFHRSKTRILRPMARKLMATHHPLVIAFDDCEGLDLVSVNLNNVALGFEAIRNLVRLGHHRILVVGTRTRNNNYHEDRISGVRMAVQQFGQDLDLRVIRVNPANPLTETLRRQLEDPRRRPTVIFFTASEAATQLIPVLQHYRLEVPHDISLLVCTSKMALPGLPMPIASMQINFDAIGAAAANSLESIRLGKPIDKTVLINIPFVHRESLVAFANP